MKKSKKAIAFVLSAGMLLSSAPSIPEVQVYAAQNAAETTDFSTSESLSVTENRTIKINEGETLVYNNITISDGKTLSVRGGGTLIVSDVTGGTFEVTDITLYAKTITGNIRIKSGNITAASVKYTEDFEISAGNINITDNISGDGNMTVSGGNVTVPSVYPNGDLTISGGTVNITKEIKAADRPLDAYGKKGYDIIIKGGDVTVTGDITAGSGGNANYSPNYSLYALGGAGGIIKIYTGNINGVLRGGTGGKCHTGNYSLPGGKGGNVEIYGGTVNGNIYGGKGDNINIRGYGGEGGDVNISGGNVTSEEIRTGEGWTNGKFTSSTNGKAYITADIIPDRTEFTSGTINSNGEVTVYGKQTLTVDLTLDKYDELTISKNAVLTVSGHTLNASGSIINDGELIVANDGRLIGTGSYTYGDETVTIPELKSKLFSINIPDDLVYCGNDISDRITAGSGTVMGFTMNSGSSDCKYSYMYTNGSGSAVPVNEAKNAGKYTLTVSDESGNVLGTEEFEIAPKTIKISSADIVKSDSSLNSLTFDGLEEGDVLTAGKDYTVTGFSVISEVASGKAIFKETDVSANYKFANGGSFTNIPVTYAHEHKFSEWISTKEYHIRECSCGETEKEAHIKDEGVITKEPTSQSEGIITYSCKVCGYPMGTETINKHTHTLGDEWVSNSVSHWHVCDECGEKADESAHDTETAYISKAPTVNTDGTRNYFCSVCGRRVKTETIPAYSKVTAEDANSMNIEDCINYVNNYIHSDDNNVHILTPAMIAAVKRVIKYDTTK